LAPAITELSRGLDFVHRVPQDPRYVSIRHLHTAYSVCEVAVLLAALVALAATARAARRWGIVKRPAWLVECGRMSYGAAWALQRELVTARQAGRVRDVVLLVEHPPVITIGRAGRSANILLPRALLAAQGFEVFEVERGGDVTYHGPGQLVGYPIVDLRAVDEDIVRYVRSLEGALIGALQQFGVSAERVRGYPGVWVGGSKIAAIGVAVKRRVTMHGFALNVAPNLDHFAVINPCGLGKPVTSMAGVLGRPVSLGEVQPVMAAQLGATLEMELAPATIDALRAHAAEPAPAGGE
jgi:lipoate-protein ligase B